MKLWAYGYTLFEFLIVKLKFKQTIHIFTKKLNVENFNRKFFKNIYKQDFCLVKLNQSRANHLLFKDFISLLWSWHSVWNNAKSKGVFKMIYDKLYFLSVYSLIVWERLMGCWWYCRQELDDLVVLVFIERFIFR